MPLTAGKFGFRMLLFFIFFCYFPGIVCSFSWKLCVISTDCWVAQPVQKETNMLPP
jgi:hypothetical protein